MQFSIATTNGPVFFIEVDPDQTFTELKKQLVETTGLEVSEQCLLVYGQELRDLSCKIANYGFNQLTCIHVIKHPRILNNQYHLQPRELGKYVREGASNDVLDAIFQDRKFNVSLSFTLLSGERISTTINSQKTVAELKQQLAEETGFAVPEQRIMFCGQELVDSRKVDSYSFEQGSRLHLLQKESVLVSHSVFASQPTEVPTNPAKDDDTCSIQ